MTWIWQNRQTAFFTWKMGNSVSMVYRNRHRNAKRDQTTIGKIIQNPRAARLFSLAMALTMVLVAVSVCIQYRNVQDQRKTQQEWHGAWQAVLMDPDLTALQEASENLVIKKGICANRSNEGQDHCRHWR